MAFFNYVNPWPETAHWPLRCSAPGDGGVPPSAVAVVWGVDVDEAADFGSHFGPEIGNWNLPLKLEFPCMACGVCWRVACGV
jgi:hypothetical protein